MTGARGQNEAERFWSHVDRTGDGCWEWQAGLTWYGYGQFARSKPFPGGTVVAHKMAWILENGHVPEGLVVRHRCDNPPCVRPDHLELGTKAENSRDMAVRRRGTASLSEEQVRQIRASQTTHVATAKALGVSVDVVTDVRRGRTYKHVT